MLNDGSTVKIESKLSGDEFKELQKMYDDLELWKMNNTSSEMDENYEGAIAIRNYYIELENNEILHITCRNACAEPLSNKLDLFFIELEEKYISKKLSNEL